MEKEHRERKEEQKETKGGTKGKRKEIEKHRGLFSRARERGERESSGSLLMAANTNEREGETRYALCRALVDERHCQ